MTYKKAVELDTLFNKKIIYNKISPGLDAIEKAKVIYCRAEKAYELYTEQVYANADMSYYKFWFP